MTKRLRRYLEESIPRNYQLKFKENSTSMKMGKLKLQENGRQARSIILNMSSISQLIVEFLEKVEVQSQLNENLISSINNVIDFGNDVKEIISSQAMLNSNITNKVEENFNTTEQLRNLSLSMVTKSEATKELVKKLDSELDYFNI